jgi:hypothetical protein|tara:strand:+ start:363 stop:650 length:288 start_codon:yes stop_codon:yes gene_type:complete
MSYFYVRNQNFMVVFKRSKTEIVSQVIPSEALEKKIQEHPTLKYEMVKTNLGEDGEDEENNEEPIEQEEEIDEDIADIDVEEDKLNPNINFRKEE